MKYQVFKSTSNNQYYWRLLAANGRSIATGGEGYHNHKDCLAAIALVKGSYSAPIDDHTVPRAIDPAISLLFRGRR